MRKTVLKNGLKIIYKRVPSKVVTVQFTIFTGANVEDKNEYDVLGKTMWRTAGSDCIYMGSLANKKYNHRVASISWIKYPKKGFCYYKFTNYTYMFII